MHTIHNYSVSGLSDKFFRILDHCETTMGEEAAAARNTFSNESEIFSELFEGRRAGMSSFSSILTKNELWQLVCGFQNATAGLSISIESKVTAFCASLGNKSFFTHKPSNVSTYFIHGGGRTRVTRIF